MTTTELSSEAKIAQFDAMVAVKRHKAALAALRKAKEKFESARRVYERKQEDVRDDQTWLEDEIKNARMKAREALRTRMENRLDYVRAVLAVSAEVFVSAGFPDDMRAKLSKDVEAFKEATGNFVMSMDDEVGDEDYFAQYNDAIEARRANLEKSSAALEKAKAEYDAATVSLMGAKNEEFFAKSDMETKKRIAKRYVTNGVSK